MATENVLKSTVLYDRELEGVHVQTRQEHVQVVEPAEDGGDDKVTEVKRYVVEAKYDGEVVKSFEPSGYRDSIVEGRKTFKEVYDEKVGQFAEAKKAEEAAAKQAEKDRKAAEREEKARLKAEEKARKAEEAAAKAKAAAEAAQSKLNGTSTPAPADDATEAPSDAAESDTEEDQEQE